MRLLPVLMGLPLGVLLLWFSEYAPCLAAKDARNAANDGFSGQGSGRPHRTCSISASDLRPDWHGVGVIFTTSGLLALLDLRFDPLWAHLPAVVASLFFLLVAIVDLKHRLVLNAMVLPAGALVLLTRVMHTDASLGPAILGAVVGLLPFLLTALAKPGSMGGGDVKLAALTGLFLGFPEVLWAISLGILSGGMVSFILLTSSRWEASDSLPYAPFLCLGAVTALLYDPVTPFLFSIAR